MQQQFLPSVCASDEFTFNKQKKLSNYFPRPLLNPKLRPPNELIKEKRKKNAVTYLTRSNPYREQSREKARDRAREREIESH